MSEHIHIVEFDKYCESCKHKNVPEADSPCDECLEIPARDESRKPERWEAED